MNSIKSPRIGIAGWSIPREHRGLMSGAGSHLERYGRRFNAVEINSSFYRPHRTATYARWADAVPVNFRFSVKVPRVITHDLGLRACRAEVTSFLEGVNALGEKLAVLLVQLPPSLEYEPRPLRSFFAQLRAESHALIACEPRHASWFDAEVEASLSRWHVSRVAADPSPSAKGSEPAGDPALAYCRLHGSPKIYYSRYDQTFMGRLVGRLRGWAERADSVWCIFDNTAAFAAWGNAVELQSSMAAQSLASTAP